MARRLTPILFNIVFLLIVGSRQTFAQGLDSNEILQLLDSAKIYLNDQPDLSKKLIDKSISYSKEYFYARGLGNGYANLGLLNYYQGDFTKALEHYNLADSIYQSINDSNLLASLYSNRGIVYILIKKYDLAINDYLKAIDINKIRKNTKKLATNYGNMAGIYFKEQKYDEALPYFEYALQLNENEGDSQGVAINVGNIGGLLLYQKKYTQAEKCFQRAMKIHEYTNNLRGMVGEHNHFGLLYEKQNEFEKARSHYSICIELAEELGAQRDIQLAMGNIASTYYKQGLYQPAVDQFLDQLEILRELKDSLELKRTYRNIAETYNQLEQYEKALDFMFQYDVINRLLNEKETNQLIQNFQTKQALYAKEKELALLERKHAIQEMTLRNRNITMLAFGAFLALLLIAVFVYLKYRNQKHKANQAILKNQLLRSQVNPHFIFNVFNSIQSYFVNKEYATGQIFLRNFAGLIRSFLEKSESEFSTLGEELKLMKKYLEIEKMRLSDRLDYEIIIDPAVDLDNCLFPSFLAQTYLENAVWHGVSEMSNQGKVVIEIKDLEDQLKLIIFDNGIGINESKRLKSLSGDVHQSKGMAMTAERMKYLNKRRKGRYSVEIVDLSEINPEERGTRVELNFPKLFF